MKAISRLVTLIVLASLVSLVGIEAAAAKDCPCWINGTITENDTLGGLVGATVANGSNVSQTVTTTAGGLYNISGFGNTTGLGINLTVTASGFTTGTISNIVVNGADNSTTNQQESIITPTISAITVSSITRSGSVIAWTTTLAAPTTNNAYIGSKVIYSLDSALATNLVNSSWTNSSTSPSFTTTNLLPAKTYYYQVESYSLANSSIKSLTTGTFVTLKAGTKSYWTPPVPQAPVVVRKQQTLIQTMVSSNPKKKVMFVMLVAIVAVIAYFGLSRKN